jgi:hypothetical protein
LVLITGYFLGDQIKNNMDRAFNDIGTDGGITLRWIFKDDGRAWTGFTWPSTEISDKPL